MDDGEDVMLYCGTMLLTNTTSTSCLLDFLSHWFLMLEVVTDWGKLSGNTVDVQPHENHVGGGFLVNDGLDDSGQRTMALMQHNFSRNKRMQNAIFASCSPFVDDMKSCPNCVLTSPL